jgi:hypothetical protein
MTLTILSLLSIVVILIILTIFAFSLAFLFYSYYRLSRFSINTAKLTKEYMDVATVSRNNLIKEFRAFKDVTNAQLKVLDQADEDNVKIIGQLADIANEHTLQLLGKKELLDA